MNQMRNYFGGGGNGGFNLPGPFGNIVNIVNKFRTFMSNPIGAILGTGINIPDNIRNNPEAITNFLRSTGRMSDDQYNQASQFASWAQGFLGGRNQQQ